MAVRVMALVWKLSPAVISAPERLVLLNLAEHCNDRGGNAWPAVRTISRETSLTARAVQKILPRLKAKGFVVEESRLPRRSVRYALDLEALHRERYSQSHDVDCEPRSQSEAAACEPGSGESEPGSGSTANVVHHPPEYGSPDPSLIRPLEPSGEPSSTSAQAPNVPLLRGDAREKAFLEAREIAIEIVAFPGLSDVDKQRELQKALLARHIPFDGQLLSLALMSADRVLERTARRSTV
jgi:DNA-binding MarR family transcriptional regulator